MKKYTLLFSLAFFSNYTYSQVGINTENPQKLFHIDGAMSSDTENPTVGMPTAAQQIDDFVVTTQGDVSAGTINPRGKLELRSQDSGFVPPRLTTTERNAIVLGRRPTGTLIYNLDISKYQLNTGTDASPIWSTIATIPDTANTTVSFKKTDNQYIYFANGGTLVTFQDTIFDNTPSGYITKLADNTTVRLRAGKTYKIEVNMGSMQSNDHNHTICSINDSSAGGLTSVSVLAHSRPLEWNTMHTMMAFVTATTTDRDIRIACSKANAGSVHFNIAAAMPVWSITITN